MSEAKAVKKSSYQLVRRYWDNKQAHEKGTVIDFEEGKQPRGSIKLSAVEAKKLRGRVIEAALDPVEGELIDLRQKVAELSALIKPDKEESAEEKAAETKLKAQEDAEEVPEEPDEKVDEKIPAKK